MEQDDGPAQIPPSTQPDCQTGISELWRPGRQDIACPKDGAPIPLDKFSVSKWSDHLYLIYCPRCRAAHQFAAASEDLATDLRLMAITSGALRRFEALEIAVGEMLNATERTADHTEWFESIAAVKSAYDELE